MSKLRPFIVLYTTEHFTVPEGYRFYAEDSDHAKEQLKDAEPEATIIWVGQTDDINIAVAHWLSEEKGDD